MNRREHRAAFQAKRQQPITEAEAREIRAISEHHFEEYRSGLDDVDGRYRMFDDDQDLDGAPL